LFRGQVALPNTTEYDERNESYLSGLESDITPAATFLPTSKEEVSTFVTACKPFVAGGLTFANRGAGQVPLPGSANIENGIIMDLSNLTGVEVHDGVVSIAAGERWSKV
jgi:FAD/FMN-containing dehydrogenase